MKVRRKLDALLHTWPVLAALSTLAISLYVAGFFPATYDHGVFRTKLSFDLQTGGGNAAAITCSDPQSCARTISSRFSQYGKEYALDVGGNEVLVKTVLPAETLKRISGRGGLTAKINGLTVFTEKDTVIVPDSLEVKEETGSFKYSFLLELSPSAAAAVAVAIDSLAVKGDFLESPLVVSIDSQEFPLYIPAEMKGSSFNALKLQGRAASKEEADDELRLISAILSNGPLEYDDISLSSIPPELGANFFPALLLSFFLAILAASLIFFSETRAVEIGATAFSAMLSEIFFSLGALAFFQTVIDFTAIAALLIPLSLGIHSVAFCIFERKGYSHLIRRALAVSIIGIFLIMSAFTAAGIVLMAGAVNFLIISPAVSNSVDFFIRPA